MNDRPPTPESNVFIDTNFQPDMVSLAGLLSVYRRRAAGMYLTSTYRFDGGDITMATPIAGISVAPDDQVAIITEDVAGQPIVHTVDGRDGQARWRVSAVEEGDLWFQDPTTGSHIWQGISQRPLDVDRRSSHNID